MLVRYDSLNRLEKPVYTLCNPGSIYKGGAVTNVVGMITDTEAEENIYNFNATSEINMRVNLIRRDDPEEDEHVCSIYRAIQNRRLLFIEGVGYFMITEMHDKNDNGVRYKDVTGKSIDIEMAQKQIPYIPNGTYKFTSDPTGTNKGILETIIETTPLWTIGHVDSTIADRWRTFEDVDISLNCLSFMMQNLQDAFECIFIFDIIHRVVNVYDQTNYVRQTDIHITNQDSINSLNITENADDIYTAISVVGNEDVTISGVNPLGSNVIYDFSYYIDWMSEPLGAKVEKWQEEVSASFDAYYDINLQYYEKLTEASNHNMEIERLNTQITMYTRCRENIVAESGVSLVGGYNDAIVENGGEPIVIFEEIADTLAGIDELIAQCESKKENEHNLLSAVNSVISGLEQEIDAIRNSMKITSYFTEDEQSELCHYIFEGNYNDEYVVITESMTYAEKFEQMKILYDRAKLQLSKASKPTQEFDVDVENFIFAKEFSQWSNQLETGCLINVELDPNDIAMLFLSNMTINYEDRSLKMTFGNRFNKFDPKSLYNDVLGQINKSANTLNYIKDALYPVKDGGFDAMKEALQTSRDITMAKALSSSNEDVVIDGSGYTGRRKLNDGSFDPRQVKIIGRNLVFTDDAWESCKVALGEMLFGDGSSAYGINAEYIIGDAILGRNLRILDEDGNDMLTVIDGKITASVGDINDRITRLEQTDESVQITIQEIQNRDVTSVRTTTGYTFDSDGLSITQDGDEIKNLINNTGMYVTRSGDEILTADKNGVNAINLIARQYLTVGTNSRFEDYTDGSSMSRTACFYLGS